MSRFRLHKMNESLSSLKTNESWMSICDGCQNWFSKSFYFAIDLELEIGCVLFCMFQPQIESNKLRFNEAIAYLSLWLWHLFDLETKTWKKFRLQSQYRETQQQLTTTAKLFLQLSSCNKSQSSILPQLAWIQWDFIEKHYSFTRHRFQFCNFFVCSVNGEEW